MEYWIAGALLLCFVFSLAQQAFTRRDLKRLAARTRTLSERAKYGARLHLDGGSRSLSDIAGAVNTLVDDYEMRVMQTERIEGNIRLSISGISHDLRTPLTVVSGYLQLLEKLDDAEKRREYIAAIESSVRTLSDLVENFYDLSRLELGDDVFDFRDVQLEDFVSERFLAFYESFVECGLEVSICKAPLSLTVRADLLAITRVLNNLIQNLLRYASGVVTVTFAEEEKMASVIIGNQTQSALPEEADKLFERFYTADSSRSNRGSSGIGLYISRKLVEGMGGTISAEKQNDRMLSITIKLPKSPSKEKEQANAG
jgi:signal transduction histidine kinase